MKPQTSNSELVDSRIEAVVPEGDVALNPLYAVDPSGAHIQVTAAFRARKVRTAIGVRVRAGFNHRSGSEGPLDVHCDGAIRIASSQQATSKCFTLGSPTITAATGTSVLLKLPVTIPKPGVCVPQDANQPTQHPAVQTTDLVAVVGTQVFGFRDNPFAALDDTSLTILVPTDIMRQAHRLRSEVRIPRSRRRPSSNRAQVKP